MTDKQGMTHYGLAIKEQVIRMVIEQGMTHQAVTLALGIRDTGRVRKWVRAYRRIGKIPLSRGSSDVGSRAEPRDPIDTVVAPPYNALAR
jgi:transposase-like protein